MTVVRSVRAGLALAVDRLDAGFHTSPGEAAAARLIASDRAISRLADHGDVRTPSRFARVWAAPGEPSVPYLRPYDTFDYLPVAADRLRAIRTTNRDALRPTDGDILITISGRNLGPIAHVGATLATFARSATTWRASVSKAQRTPATSSTPTCAGPPVRRSCAAARPDRLSTTSRSRTSSAFPSRRSNSMNGRRSLLVGVPRKVVHPGPLGGWWCLTPPVPRRTPDEAAR